MAEVVKPALVKTTSLRGSIDSLPESKSKKYDRQLRLWGDHGQTSLESAKVCLINATATGSEILKNLILPGIGSFTVIDWQTVTGEDVGNNFFLDRDSIGKSRAEATTTYLKELNADVVGIAVSDTIETLLDYSSTYFNNFQLVITANLSEKLLLRLSSILWENDIPLLICRSYGFIGYMRLVVKEHTVIESHPDNIHEDLRLDHTFPGLAQFCDSLDLDEMNLKSHSHTPWLVIIHKYLQKWKLSHDGKIPANYKEKNEFKALIKTGIRTKESGSLEEEENFEEAMRNVNTALLPTKIPLELQQIFTDECCTNLHFESKPFWIMARAVKDFTESDGQGLLPVRGTIPDMTSDSERYIQLQNVYRDQANLDINLVASHVLHILQSLGRDEPLTIQKNSRSPASSPAKPEDCITDEVIKTFCKNASFLRVIRCRSLASEYDAAVNTRIAELGQNLDDSDDDDIVYYILLRSVDRFYNEFNRYPGDYSDHIEVDIPELKSCVHKLMHEYGLPPNIKDEYIHELYGACELHSVASFLAGAAAQEAVKLITGQFIPVNNTFIYNAIKQTTATLQL